MITFNIKRKIVSSEEKGNELETILNIVNTKQRQCWLPLLKSKFTGIKCRK